MKREKQKRASYNKSRKTFLAVQTALLIEKDLESRASLYVPENKHYIVSVSIFYVCFRLDVRATRTTTRQQILFLSVQLKQKFFAV